MTTHKNLTQSTNVDKIVSGVLQSIIAGGIIWVATEINKIETKVATMEERTKTLEEVRPAINALRINQEEVKERLIRVEDNQHHIASPH